MSLPDGIYTPVPTFFNDNYELDLDTQIIHAKSLYDNGINGLVVCGSMGESIHLTRKERLTVLSTIRQAIADPQFKLILGMPYTNTVDIIDEITHAADVGADYVILLTPGYYGNKLTHQTGIIDYYKQINQHSKLPIIIYHYPGVSNGTNISPQTFATLKTLDNIVAVKLTHFNMDDYILLNHDDNQQYNFKPFTGLGQILVPSLSIGVHGAIDGLSGIFPKSMVHLYSLYKAGKFQEARELQFIITKANQMIFDINLVGVKHAMQQYYQLGNGKARPPLNNIIDDDTWKKYQPDLDRLHAFEQSL